MTTRLLMAGDAHGDTRFIQKVYGCAHRNAVDIIIQLGDLGWAWPRSSGSTAKTIFTSYRDFKIPFWFLPGNHDNYDFLPEDERKAGDHNLPLGPWPLANPGNHKTVRTPLPGEEAVITYLPRGCRFQIGAWTFGALGGAYSIDKNPLGDFEGRINMAKRTGVRTWWPQEIPPPFTAERLIEGGKIDILLSHDAPLNVEVFSHHRNDAKLWQESRQTRRLLQDIVDACAPAHCFHGHHHVRYDETIYSAHGGNRDCKVHGLGFNYGKFEDAVYILDVPDKEES